MKVVLLYYLHCLFIQSSYSEKTLRSLIGHGFPVELKRLAAQVETEYANQDIQFDNSPQPPFEGTDKRISSLNKKYSDILFEGDIRVSRGQLYRLLRNKRSKRQAIRGNSSLWPKGIVPYSFHYSINSYKRRAIQQSIDFWEKETCLDFRPRTSEGVYLHFVGHDDGCWSTVGRDPSQKEQWISIGDGCEPFGISSHEIAHALGLFHEQSRYDRDDHIVLIASRVPNSLLYNFAKATKREINNYNLPYDMGSVMHYSPVEFTKIPGQPSLIARDSNLQQTMGSLEGPSFIDIQIMNKHYQCHKRCKTSLKCTNGGFIDSRNCAKCKCPTGFNGQLCQNDDYGNTPLCGGELIAENQEKHFSFSISSNLSSQRTCNYHIKAPKGKRISILVKNVKGKCEHGCGNDRVEFKVDKDVRPIGYRFCCPEDGNRRFTSSSSSLPVLLSSIKDNASVSFTYRIE